MDYVKPELLIVTAVLYFFGIALKQAEFIKDKIHPNHAWSDRYRHLWDLGDIYCTFCRDTGCVDRSFRIRNAGHCCCRTEYLHPSDHQAGRKRRVGVEVVWH